MTDLIQFSQQIQQEPDLQTKLATVTDKQVYLQLVVELASKRGYIFSVKEAEAFIF